MSETDTPTETPGTDTPSTDTPAADSPIDAPNTPAADDTAKLMKESAGYRRQVREVEAARDAALDRLGRLQRREVEHTLASKLADVGDSWNAHPTLDNLVGDDGDIDTAKVEAALGALLTAHPHYAPARRPGALPGARGGLPTTPEPSTLDGILAARMGRDAANRAG